MYVDLERAFGLESFRTIFDVGANAGQSALAYLRYFPQSTIYSFEPVRSTYRKLEHATRPHPRIRTFCCAMGKEKSTGQINVNPDDSRSSILHARPEDETESIALDSVSHFARENRIDTIDFLKIDTEGYELEVLKGSVQLLACQRIHLVLAECAPLAKNNGFVSYPALTDFFWRFKYELFGIYEQQLHWDGKKCIQYFNALFVCEHFIDRNR
ncbi:MAG: FkbM family methyltransferase [Chthoniobacterales bacterium]